MKAQIVIKAKEFTLRLALGQGSSVVTDGLGGWTEVSRPDGRPITEWVGAPALKVDVPVMLDGWPRESVEKDKDRLFRLGRKRNGEKEPDSFIVTGPIFFSGMRMVLNGTPDFGADQIIRNENNGRLLRLPATLHLMEYVKGDQIRIARTKKGAETTNYRVKKGDTCRSIAKRQLGSVTAADEIAKLNGIRDVRMELKEGTVIRLPAGLFVPA